MTSRPPQLWLRSHLSNKPQHASIDKPLVCATRYTKPGPLPSMSWPWPNPPMLSYITLGLLQPHRPIQGHPTDLPTVVSPQAGHHSFTGRSPTYHAHNLHKTSRPHGPHTTQQSTDASVITQQHADNGIKGAPCRDVTIHYIKVPPLGTHITTATSSLPRQSHCTPFNHPPYPPLVPSLLSTQKHEDAHEPSLSLPRLLPLSPAQGQSTCTHT